MSETVNETGGTGPSHRSVEIGVALTIAAFGVICIIGSMQVGIGWGDEGPRAGFFPFYIGVAIVISSVANLLSLFVAANDNKLFADWDQLSKVLSVVLPTAVYVSILPYIGIYVASALLIGSFMIWLGKYRWPIAAAVAVVVPLLVFVFFERWFLVPLPKGPLERMLGF